MNIIPVTSLFSYRISLCQCIYLSTEILQAHLLDGRVSSGASVDSARQNLSATFVNAFVNAGFGQVYFQYDVQNKKNFEGCPFHIFPSCRTN